MENYKNHTKTHQRETIIQLKGSSWKHKLLQKYVKLPNHPMQLRIWMWLHKISGLDYLLTKSPSNVIYYLNLKDWVQYQIYFHVYYEPLSVNLFKKLSTESDVIFDIGAHVGQYALEAASTDSNFTKKIFAIEPNPKTFTFLYNNIQLNYFKNIFPILAAVAPPNKLIKLTIPAYWNLGNTQITKDDTEEGFYVSVVDIKELMIQHQLSKIDVIKIDIEGNEYHFFYHIFNIDKIFPKNIIFEYIPDVFPQNKKLITLLLNYGYTIKTIDGLPYSESTYITEQNLWAERTTY